MRDNVDVRNSKSLVVPDLHSQLESILSEVWKQERLAKKTPITWASMVRARRK